MTFHSFVIHVMNRFGAAGGGELDDITSLGGTFTFFCMRILEKECTAATGLIKTSLRLLAHNAYTNIYRDTGTGG